MYKVLFTTILLIMTLVFCPIAKTGGAEGVTSTGYESVTIDNTVGGVGLTSSQYTSASTNRIVADYAIVILETAKIRFTLDGSTAPTTTVGMPLEVGQGWILDGHDLLKNFKAIRTTDTSGVLKVLYFKRN